MHGARSVGMLLLREQELWPMLERHSPGCVGGDVKAVRCFHLCLGALLILLGSC